ncbi:hypothetical protein COUCH_36170 [Couchioplanes caeruleus]|uniref:hypothetical protein n=1 Tax=Couchioplanes caeruleus TaxID=56438 RepID=UPI0020BE7F61|nr:hypothetical protein [Couchioplanes caeruleus]UQU64337.1 hypothetical protein COUCH_36170 [Couchioplanes caeruleus]
MEFALEFLAVNSGRVVVIWLALIVLAVVALGGLALPDGVRRPRQITAWLAESAAQKRAGNERRAAEVQEMIRYADEVAVAARGAAATAERRREECQQAQAAVERAWQAWQDADAALERARRAAAYAVPATEPAPADDADRVQALRRAAQAAYRRGDLSDGQLLDALTHRNGWDPTLHPVEQELVLARAAVSHRFAAYQQALDAEDAAWQAADVATAAVRTLRQEATAAMVAADAARQALPEPARTILDRAGNETIVVTAPAPAPVPAGLDSLGIGDGDAAVTQPVVVSAETTQPVLLSVETTQAVATQEVRPARSSRREVPAWAQPTAGRPQVAGVR